MKLTSAVMPEFSLVYVGMSNRGLRPEPSHASTSVMLELAQLCP